MKRILFVDDEQHVLDGLKDSLRKQRKQWDMVFANGGQDALAHLERGAFDVIVSDMRMPGMDGVALLQWVRDRYPATARIILSGHAEREAVVNALPVSHQFLSKPCEADVLRAVVERACGLQALLHDESVRSVIGKLDRLPSAPHTYWELTQVAGQPNVGVSDLATIVEQDPAIALKVLQIVNSSYFGLAQKQTSIARAVSYLGTDLLKSLALSAHVFSSAGSNIKGSTLEAMQRHSLVTARIAKRFFDDKERAGEAFSAALVHDVGKLVMAMSVPARFADVLLDMKSTGRPDFVVEKELLGVTHAEVGAYLLGLWGLPLSIVEAVAHHHHLERITPTHTSIAVHVADALSHPCADSDPTAGGRLNVTAVEASPFGSQLARWRTLAEEERRATT